MNHAEKPRTARVTGWDRAVVIALGTAGCALSYDALQQMAAAIHVRGPLTYLFPLVIDGFIAYGVRALLVLRNAPLRSRLYVWMLFGTATAVSVWANALHAVRLNQQHPLADGLRLSDTVVATLSTVAPLALAGAVHLYILIARAPVTVTDHPSVTVTDRGPNPVTGSRPSPVSDRAEAPVTTSAGQLLGGPVTPAARVGHSVTPAGRDGLAGSVPVTSSVGAPDRPGHGQIQRGGGGAGQPVRGTRSLTPDNIPAGDAHPDTAAGTLAGLSERPVSPQATGAQVTGDQSAASAGQPVADLPVTTLPVTGQPVTGRSDGQSSPVTGPPVTSQPVTGQSESVTDQPLAGEGAGGRMGRSVGDRRGDRDTEELLEIARSAVRAEDKLTRKVVAQAIRGQQIPLSSDTLTALMVQLRAQHGHPVTTPRT